MAETREQMAARMEKASVAVYLACEETVADDISAMLRAGAAALRAQGWQPITTAPRDWTSVLVYDHASAAVGQAYFRSDDDDGVWCWANLNQMDEDGVVGEPTHWMPLPSPPEAD